MMDMLEIGNQKSLSVSFSVSSLMMLSTDLAELVDTELMLRAASWPSHHRFQEGFTSSLLDGGPCVGGSCEALGNSNVSINDLARVAEQLVDQEHG